MYFRFSLFWLLEKWFLVRPPYHWKRVLKLSGLSKLPECLNGEHKSSCFYLIVLGSVIVSENYQQCFWCLSMNYGGDNLFDIMTFSFISITCIWQCHFATGTIKYQTVFNVLIVLFFSIHVHVSIHIFHNLYNYKYFDLNTFTIRQEQSNAHNYCAVSIVFGGKFTYM